MDITINEPIVVGYTCCGPTYRKTAYDRIKNYYFDNDNIYYCIVTDNKEYFSDLERKNLIINELKDFYEDFPELEKNESFLLSNDKNDYAERFLKERFLFPMSTYRFNVLQSIKLGIKNVSLICTDTVIDFNKFNNDIFENKNLMYNAVSWWYETVDTKSNVSYANMKIISDYLNEKYGYQHPETVLVLDEAARLFIPNNLDDLKFFFKIWNEVVEFLYKTNYISNYRGGYVIHDEFILAIIYNFLKIQFPIDNPGRFFDVKHNKDVERFWV